MRQRRPDADPASLIATGWPQARRLIEQYIAAGLTKFVIRPAAPGVPFGQFLDGLREHLLPLQN